MKIEIDKQSGDFIRKIEFVIGAIQNDIARSSSSWKVRHELLRIESFQKLIERTVFKSLANQGNMHNQLCFQRPSAF